MDEGALSEGRLKEYEMLRQELMHYDRSVLQVLGITLGFLGVITAQGIASGSPYVFVVALPLLIVVHSYVADKRWVIWTVASYLRRFVEDRDLGPRWETELYWFRTACRKVGGFTPGQNIMRVECALFALLGLMELALFANGACQRGLGLHGGTTSCRPRCAPGWCSRWSGTTAAWRAKAARAEDSRPSGTRPTD